MKLKKTSRPKKSSKNIKVRRYLLKCKLFLACCLSVQVHSYFMCIVIDLLDLFVVLTFWLAQLRRILPKIFWIVWFLVEFKFITYLLGIFNLYLMQFSKLIYEYYFKLKSNFLIIYIIQYYYLLPIVICYFSRI